MEALSIDNDKEDKKEKFYFNVFVYNKQPGIKINYESGKCNLDGSWTELKNRLNNECDCVFNINTKKIHKLDHDCKGQKAQEEKIFIQGFVKYF